MDMDFFASFIDGASAATELLPVRPLDEGAWAAAARRASGRCLAPELLAEIRRQSGAFPASPARERSLQSLSRENATVVVTGQQVGLFLGPLYTLHKAATAISRARLVEHLTGLPCVPIFWLQTEDHDWAEIASAEVLVPSGRKVLALPPGPPDAARVSLSHRSLPAEVDGLVVTLAEILEPLPHAAEVASLVGRHYRSGITPGAAFAGVLDELFAQEGLIVLDPRTPAVSRLAAPVLRRAVLEHAEIGALLAARAAELLARGFSEQVPTRGETSLAFFHPHGPGGPRYRLVRDGAGFSTPEGPVTRDALLSRLEEDPLLFSSSALLRPLVQDTLLPTTAYVGGPAECSYFAQLTTVYARFGLELPMIAPRARLRIVVPRNRRDLERLGLGSADTDRPREVLLRELVARPPGVPPSEELHERLLGSLERELAALAAPFAGLDPLLERNIRKTREQTTSAVGKLVAGVERALARKDDVTVKRLDGLLEALRPSGKPQERVYAFPALAALAGCRPLVDAVLAASAPLSPAVRDVNL
jgi:bacillithiol biosynthesis cysteine-adding enzyme BshC